MRKREREGASVKPMTVIQAKEHLAKAMCDVLGIPVELTRAGKLTVKTKKMLNAAGYFWFPGRKIWDKVDKV